MIFISFGGGRGSGGWYRNRDVEKNLKKIEEKENLWRAQEAKILKVLNLCAALKSDNLGIFVAAMEKVCARIEQNPDMQSLLIRETLKDVMTKAPMPEIAGRAAFCHATATWTKCANDHDENRVVAMSYDRDIVQAQNNLAKNAQDDISLHAPFLTAANDMQRTAAIIALTKHAVNPAGVQRIRDIFNAARADENLPLSAQLEISTGLQKILQIQEAEISALAADIASNPPAIRPRLIRP